MTDTTVNSLVINNLTKTQFDNVQSPSPTEIWSVDPEFTGGKLLQTNASGDIEESTLEPTKVLENKSTSTTVGSQGLSIGGHNSTNGSNQVVVGYYAGQNSWSYPGGTVLADNLNISVGFGAGSMPYTTYGDGNIAIGFLANSVDGILGMFTGYTAAEHNNCIAIGYLAHAYSTNGIAIGSSTDGTTTTATEAYLHSIAIGTSTKALANRSMAIGYNSSASGNGSMAFGRNAEATANYAIQLGRGTNSTANTLSVGLSASDNYELLSSDGKIPAARLTNAIQGAITSTTVTLTSAGWSSNTQTVSVTGMTASSVVWVSPVGASMADYASGGVYCSAQASGTLTFTCSTAPSSDLTVQVIFG